MVQYLVYIKGAIENGKLIISPKNLTAKNAKDKAVSSGLFTLSDRKFLRVKRKR